MLPQILTIIELSLRLALKIAEDMPPEERKKHWERWSKFLDFWQDLADKIKSQITDPGINGG